MRASPLTFLAAATVFFGSFAWAQGSGVPARDLLLWLDASDAALLELAGERVSAWRSRGPEAAVAAADGARRPRFVPGEPGVVRPGVWFDGEDDVLRVSGVARRTDTWTLAVVVAPHFPAKGGGVCSACPAGGEDYDPGFTVDLYQASAAFDQISVEGAGRIGGQKDQMTASLPWGGAHLVVVTRGPETVGITIDGVEQEIRPVAPAATVMEELRVGARHYGGMERQYFHGTVSQLLLYGRALDPGERAALESALAVGEAERKAGEERHAGQLAEARRERLENRMKPPVTVGAWPDTDAFLAALEPGRNLSRLPVRTDLREAVSLCMTHLNSLYDHDRDNEPFFYANRMADGTGKMFHSVNIGIPHVVGRCLLGCMAGERATGIPFPPEGLAILERYCRSSFDNPDHLNSYYDPEQGGARCVEFHNMREGLYGLWALAAGRDVRWAREKGRLMLATLDQITDADGRWSAERVKALDTGSRCYGVSVPNAARMVDALLAWHDATGDALAMKLAGMYARAGLGDMFGEDGRFAPMDRSSGHVHSVTSSLSGITDYAVRTGDAAMLEKCRRIVDRGVPEYFSSWGWGDEVFPDHPADEVSRGEINQTGDVVRTALLLGGAGHPRYYELAERYLRSMILPAQHLEGEMRGYLRDRDEPSDDSERDVLRRTVGGFAMQRPNDRMRAGDWPLSTLDITSGAVHALSEACRRGVKMDGDACTVNLLFDAETGGVTVRSALPFEGRLEVEARRALRPLRVCLPPWVDPATVVVSVGGQPRPFSVREGVLDMGEVTAGETGIVTFSVPCRREKETVDGTGYTTTWVGSQIIEILPRGEVSPLPF